MQCILSVPHKGSFKWLSKQYKVSWDSPETHYIAFAWGKLEVNIGSYVVVEKPKTPNSKPTEQKQCLVAKVIELFDEGNGDSVETAFARVNWFSHTAKIQPELRKQLMDTGSTSRELLEDIRPFQNSRIPVSSFVCKCFVMLLDHNVFGTSVWDTAYNGVPLFYCRWRYDGGSLQPLARSEPPPPPPTPAPRGRGRPRIHPITGPRIPNITPQKVLDPFCPMCNISFHNFQMLGDHIGQVHYNGEGPLSCPFCPEFVCYTLSKLKAHLRNHSRPNFQCSMCKKQFKHLSHLRAHAVLHTDAQKNKVMKCVYCSYTSDKLIPMKRHMIVMHKGKFPYNCSICHKGFVLPSLLLRHKDLCTIGNPGDDLESEDFSEDSEGGGPPAEVPQVELSMDQLNEISTKIQETEQPSTSQVLVKASTSAAPPAKGIFAMSQQAQETLASVLEEATEGPAKQAPAPASEPSDIVGTQSPSSPPEQTSPVQIIDMNQNAVVEQEQGNEVIEDVQAVPSQDEQIAEVSDNMEVTEVVPERTEQTETEKETILEEAVAPQEPPADQEMADISKENQEPQESMDQETPKEVVQMGVSEEQQEWVNSENVEEANKESTAQAQEEEPMEVSAETPQEGDQEQREIIFFESPAGGSSEEQTGVSSRDIHKLVLGGSELTAIDNGDGQLIIDSSQLALHQDGEESVIYLTQDELYAGGEGTQYIIIQPEMLQGGETDDQTSVLVYNPSAGTAEVPQDSAEVTISNPPPDN